MESGTTSDARWASDCTTGITRAEKTSTSASAVIDKYVLLELVANPGMLLMALVSSSDSISVKL